MANMKLKKDFVDNEKLPAKDLNNNFAVIEECINNTKRGLSAYEQSLENEYEGTEEEWLKSLVGPQGPQGEPGTKGKPAATAGGYALFQSPQEIINAHGYDNIFSDYEIIITNMGITLPQNDIPSVQINSENIDMIKMTYDIFYTPETMYARSADMLDFVIELYSEDMSVLLNTYKFSYEIPNVVENFIPFTSINGDFSIDTSSLNIFNLVIKVNVLKNEGEVISDGTLTVYLRPVLLEAFS